MASGGAVANPDAMGLAEVAEFYCALLAGRGGAGMLMSRVPEEWIQTFKTPLPLKRLGFSKVAQLLSAMPQLKVVTNGPSCMVYLASAETGDGVAGGQAAAHPGQGAGFPGGAASGELGPGELAPGETTKRVRDWLRARVERGGASGVLASRIPSLWAEDFPTAGPLPLKQMGVNKLIKFLHACSDIVRMARPTLMDGTSSVTELLIFPADNAAGEHSAGGTQGGTQPPAPAVDPALLVRQGNQTWVKAAELSRAPPPPQESDAPSHQSPAGTEAPAGGAALTLSGTAVAEVQERPRAPGTERQATQLRATEIEEMYGKGFAMLAKMGYAHDNAKLSKRTPIAVAMKTDKKGLYLAGEEDVGGRGVNGKQQSETQGKDAEFVKDWLRKLLKSFQGEWGTMEPLAMSRIPDLWSQQFSGTFPVKTLGYKKLINVLQAFNDVVKVVGGGPGGVDVLPADEEGQGPAKRARLEPGVARHGVHGTGAQESANYNNGVLSAEDAYAQQYGFASAAQAYALAQADWSARAAAYAATPFPQGGQQGSAQASGAVPGFRDPYGSSGVQQTGVAAATATSASNIQFDQHRWPAAQGNEHGAAHPGASSAHPDWSAMEGWCAEQQAIIFAQPSPAVSLNSVTNSATNPAAAAGDWRQAAAATMHAYAHAQHAAHAQSGAWSASAQHMQHVQLGLPYSSVGMAAMTGFTGGFTGLTSANTSSS